MRGFLKEVCLWPNCTNICTQICALYQLYILRVKVKMVGEKGGKLHGKKIKNHIQENGAPNNDCLLDPGLGAPLSHYTRHAKIPCTMHAHDFSHTTILMREILQYTMESTLLYGKPEMSDETRNE